MTAAEPTTLPYADLGFSPLYTAYTTDFERVAPFYNGDWRDPQALAAAAEAAAAQPHPRDSLADALLAQNSQWGLDDATRAHIEALRSDDSAAVLTGQQVGLFGGPLYTLYKAVTAIQLARRLEADTGRPTVPVFWLADEDHDFAEINHAVLFDGRDPATVAYTDGLPPEANRGPVGRIVPGSAIEKVLDAVAEVLPKQAHTEDVMALLRRCYTPETNLRDGFARLLKALLPGTGLVLVSPDDPALKAMAAPLFAAEIQHFEHTHERFQAASAAVAEAFHAQVETGPLKLFFMTENGRFALDPDGDTISVRHTDRMVSRESLIQLAQQRPDQLSPNVALRPLMQDALFPTAAYVAGPGETAYFAQLKPLYEFFGLPMPIIYPRASVTACTPKARKVMAQYDLDLLDLRADVDGLLRRLVVADHVDAGFDAAHIALDKHLDELKPLVQDVDTSLDTAVEAARAKAGKALEALRKKTVRVQKKQHDTTRTRLTTAHTLLFPNGHLQERTFSALPFLNRFGLDLAADWPDTLALDTSAHQVIDL